MTALLTPPAEVVAFPYSRLIRFTVEQYHRMIEIGVLNPDLRCELLEGILALKMPHNPPHDESVEKITWKLTRTLSEEWRVRVQCAITLNESEPEPDFAVVRRTKDKPRTRHPGPDDIALLIEVADSTLLTDHRYKATLYARAGIRAFWIVNVAEAIVEVYTQPQAGENAKYQSRTDYAKSAAVPLTLDGVSFGPIAIVDLLP